MWQARSKTDFAKLRRIALNSQGLLHKTPFGRGKAAVTKAISHIGYVQLDTISVVERAHHHVLFSRVPNFQPDMTNQLLNDRSIFEYWAHAAAILPIDDYRFSLPYKNAIRGGQIHWYKDPDRKLMKDLLTQIQHEGPLKARDVQDNASNRQGWWDWKPAKKALEQLYMQGDLMVSDRTGFQKTYDLTERVLPSGVDTSEPTVEEYADHLLQQQMRSQGIFTLPGVSYLRRNAALRQAIKTLVEEQIHQGSLTKIELVTGEQLYAKTELLERTAPRSSNRLHILSPFDNSVIQRDRLNAIFAFNYQLECYVPEAKRKYGYFSLPLLYRDQFVGQVDCKTHRKAKQLEIKSLHIDFTGFDPQQLMAAFAESLSEFCRFQQCDDVCIGSTVPAELANKIYSLLS